MRVTIYYTNRFKGCPGGIEAFELEGPGPFRVNFESLDGGGHQATRPEPARTRSGARPPFFSGCHSAATDGLAAARSLKPGIGSSPLMSPRPR